MNPVTDASKDRHTTVIDSRDGSGKAAGIGDSPRPQSLFEDLHERRTRQAGELRDDLATADIELADDGTTLASVHRQFVEPKDLVTDNDNAVLAEVVPGEPQPVDAYDEATRPMNMSNPAFALAAERHHDLKTFAQDGNPTSARKEFS